MRTRTLRSLLALAGLALSLLANEARAGGVNILTASVEINGGQNRPARPGESLSMTFLADMFAFGSDESEYLIFSIIPEQKSIARLDRLDIDTLHLFAYVLGKVENQPGIKEGNRPTVQLEAPKTPGKYKIIYNRVPYFVPRPFASSGPPGSTFVPPWGEGNGLDLARHVWEYRSELTEVQTLVVAEGAPVTAVVPPSLYLSVNGETPGLKPLKTGTVETPLTFRWNVNSDFQLPRKNLLYRYQMTIDGDAWSKWSPARGTSLFFLPKGAHEFRVQAKYDGPEGVVTSQIARYSFFLSDPFVARPTKGALSKPATLGNIALLPTPDVGTVYSGSRALLFGIYAFKDKATFAQLPKDRIERDVTTLKNSLARNGFDVASIVRPSITTLDVRVAIDGFIKSSRNNERLFIYFSSHGFADPNQPADGYVATTDCQARSASATCLALNSLRQQFNESMVDRDARQIVIAVDSCFAGLGVVVKSVPDSNLAELTRHKGIYMLTAGMENQTAQIDDAFKMSTFTYYLSQGMDGGADFFKSGVISLTELFLYVQYQVADRTKSSQIPMMGRILGSGEMLFRVPTPQKATQ